MQEYKIKENLLEVKSALKQALLDAGRDEKDCDLVAVSKTRDEEELLEAIKHGHKVFGENKVQEAQEKWPKIKEKYGDVELHLIGPLQSNKARQAVKLFDVIETLDREKLAKSLARIMKEENKFPKIYIQVNTGEEEQKAGVLPEHLTDFLNVTKGLGLEIEGLMCIPPQGEEPSLHFALLHNLANKHGIKKLSMGMSDDFEVAAKLGATSVRVGTSIFGERNYN